MKYAVSAAVCMTLVASEGACSLVTDLGPKKELGRTDPSRISAGDGSVPPALQALRVAVGPTQACAIVSAGASGPSDSGEVRCWGDNRAGELGSDPLRVRMSTTPLPVAGSAAAVKALTLAKDYACAVTTDQFLVGWGHVPIDPVVRRSVGLPQYEPLAMEFLGETIGRVVAASVGVGGGCYTMTDGSLVCWGAFAQGLIQDGRVVLSGGLVTRADAFESVVVGRAHACGIARRSDDTRVVECWGANEHEQAGVLNEPPDKPGPPRVNVPTEIGLPSTAKVMQVAAGGNDSCARVEDGSVYCWGANDLEQLGIVDPRDRSAPILIDLPAKAVDVAVGEAHACALLETTNVWCWGDNSWEQLGGGPLSDVPSPPVAVQQLVGVTPESLRKVRTIAAGGMTTCATLEDDPFVWCWGANIFGQAGQMPTAFVSYATAVGW